MFALILLLAFLHPALLLGLALVLGAVATALDLAPLISGVFVPLLTPILSAAALWVAYKAAAVLHFHVQDGQRALLEKAIANGLAWAAGKLVSSPVTFDTKSATVAAVVQYVNTTAPGAVKSLGLDKNANALAAAITARLPQNQANSAAPP